ncbi:MAG: Uma2 family endonuclease [Leptospiraceae bacterium]|nr:Uma2 family endonuclease [Leptospiraceae bacterium]MCP5499219.1 Uma2 family endonuclease [Leptospiraceae bacterium]
MNKKLDPELLQDAAEQLYLIPVDLYHQMLELDPGLEKTELFEGVILRKMTKSTEHNFYTNLLYELLRELKPSGTFIQTEKTIQLERSELEPDISIVEGSMWDFIKRHPRKALLIVEVSKTSLAYDRQKLPLYAEAGVEEYWIVDVNTKVLEIYKQPREKMYMIQKSFTFQDEIPVFGKTIKLSK